MQTKEDNEGIQTITFWELGPPKINAALFIIVASHKLVEICVFKKYSRLKTWISCSYSNSGTTKNALKGSDIFLKNW